MKAKTAGWALCALALAACATVVRGSRQDVFINTVPLGATVELSNGLTCTTPCTAEAIRDEPLEVRITRPGCRPVQVTLTPEVSNEAVESSALVDYASGAAYDLRPNPLELVLTCGG